LLTLRYNYIFRDYRLVEFLKDYAKIKSVHCGSAHTHVVTDDGEILSFGVGEFGRLGTLISIIKHHFLLPLGGFYSST